jgi:hypothetical protein
MREGYLVALIVWPVELSPGAWLPLIWGIRGWKVAAKIATLEKYDRFIALVMGMFQELERRLSASPASATFVLTKDAPYLSGRYFAGAAWSTGFMTALYESSAGLGTRTAAVRGAVEAIARHASSRSTESNRLPSVATALNIAVMTIMSERPSRAPIHTVRLNKAMLRASETVGAIQQTAAIVTDVRDRHVVTQLTAEKAIGSSLYST